MKDKFIRSRLIAICAIFFCMAPHSDQNRDRNSRKVHLKQQIKIAPASNINWYELLKVCQTNQNCHQTSFFPQWFVWITKFGGRLSRNKSFLFLFSQERRKMVTIFQKPLYKRNLTWRLKQKLKILPFPPDLAWVRWIGMINVGCRAYLELERGLQLQYFNQREKFKHFQLGSRGDWKWSGGRLVKRTMAAADLWER